MSSLFRLGTGNLQKKRENDIKDALINYLQENAKEIQYEVTEFKKDVIEVCAASSSLCNTLEAIFLHGLKDSFLWQTLNALSNDVDRRPEPSFWPPLMVFLHKQVLKNIEDLSQVNCEIGQCRAWIRLSLNECMISAYMKNMRNNNKPLRSYYKNTALLQDAERFDIICSIMEGLESSVTFKLPVNTSLYNQWPDLSLQLSGLWSPALKSLQITSGVDIAGSLPSSLNIPTPGPLNANEFFSESISSSPFERQNDFPASTSESTIEENDQEEKLPENEVEVQTKAEASENDDLFVDENLPGNSITNRLQTSWSADLPSPSKNSKSIDDFSSSQRSSTNTRFSYNTLLKNHENARSGDWSEFWEKFSQHNSQRQSMVDSLESREHDGDDEDNDLGGFEVLHENVKQFDVAELQYLVGKLCHLSQEPGLKAQGFACKECKHPLGIGLINYEVCSFTGNYFCSACMALEATVIPAFIIYNWDFGKYTVCKRVAIFLNEFCNEPFIDFKLLNPEIYEFIDTMAELQTLRIRLNFIRTYLISCNKSQMLEEMQRLFYGKEYLYEHIHQYSIIDLVLIKRGNLQRTIEKFCKTAEKHILNCMLCSVKGFICEICRAAQVLYPFHIETTFRCQACGAVFHPTCLNEQQPCPKCLRRSKREAQQAEKLQL